MAHDGSSHVGHEFGNYRVAEVLGKGGTSVVYRAIHKSIESEVAMCSATMSSQRRCSAVNLRPVPSCSVNHTS